MTVNVGANHTIVHMAVNVGANHLTLAYERKCRC